MAAAHFPRPLMAGVDEGDMVLVKSVFEQFDPDHSGLINSEVLRQIIPEIAEPITDGQVRWLLSRIFPGQEQQDKGDKVSYNDFVDNLFMVPADALFMQPVAECPSETPPKDSGEVPAVPDTPKALAAEPEEEEVPAVPDAPKALAAEPEEEEAPPPALPAPMAESLQAPPLPEAVDALASAPDEAAPKASSASMPAKAPEATPDEASPKLEKSEGAAPEEPPPETSAPEAPMLPETQEALPEAPDEAVLKAAPGEASAQAPEATPDATSPKAAEAEAVAPESAVPEASAPESFVPEVAAPEELRAAPETQEPEGALAKEEVIESSSPEVAQPEASSPEPSDPEEARPAGFEALRGADAADLGALFACCGEGSVGDPAVRMLEKESVLAALRGRGERLQQLCQDKPNLAPILEVGAWEEEFRALPTSQEGSVSWFDFVRFFATPGGTQQKALAGSCRLLDDDLRAIFAFIDRNGNSLLEKEEVLQAVKERDPNLVAFCNQAPHLRPLMHHSRWEHSFRSLDTDRSGEVSWDEFNDFFQRVFSALSSMPPN